MSKGKLTNFGLIFAATCVSVLLAEGAVRLFAPQETVYPRWGDSEEYPIALPANATIVHSRGSAWHLEYTTNERGRRGPYIAPTDTAETTNIVALGDSYTFGWGVTDDEVYTQVLRDLLGPDYSVANEGMGGYGIDSEIKTYFKEGAAYQPRIVILQFCSNDPSDFSGVTQIEDSEFIFRPNPKHRPAIQRAIAESSLLQQSHLFALIRNYYVISMKADINEAAAKVDSTPAEQRYAEMLRKFAVTLNSRGTALLFVSVTHEYPDGTYHYDVDNFPVIKNEVEQLKAQGLLRFVTLPTDEMRKYPGTPDGHTWASEHHRLVAGALAEAINNLENETQRPLANNGHHSNPPSLSD